MQVEIPISEKLTVALGKELAKARIDAALTQEQVAEAADLSPNYLGQLENGRLPSYDTLRAVCKVLKVSPPMLAQRIANVSTLPALVKRAEAFAALCRGLEEVL